MRESVVWSWKFISLLGSQRMSSKWTAHRVVGLASGVLVSVGLLGLLLCRLIQLLNGWTEQELLQAFGAAAAAWILGSCLILGLVILFPLTLLLQRRAGVNEPLVSKSDWLPLRIVIRISFVLLLLGALVQLVGKLIH